MNKFSFSRPDDAVKAMNAAFSEVRSSDEFSWITELFWGTLNRIDDDMSAEEVAEIIDSLLNVCPDSYSETYDKRVCVDFLSNVNEWNPRFVSNIVIETSDYTADELITTALNDMEDDEFLSRICELNSHIIREAALYFVVVFAKNYGIDYNDFWNKFKL